jgi:phosphate transport system substrate-binding protein
MQRRRIQGVAAVGVAAALASFMAACSSSGSGSGSSSSSSGGGSGSSSLSGTLNASGSTFQLPFQQAAIQQFKQVQPSLTVNYGGGGSGKGRTDLASGVVNFAGSDSPIPSDETSNFKGKTVLYFPVAVGPITMSYNLSGVKNLKLDATVIANIFQGKIKTWNDPAIKALNSGANLPSTPITLAVRSDSSGTTSNFSLFLMTAVPSVWKLGSSSTINWPSSAHAGNGNGGVAQIVKSTPGAIGYVDYADAKATGLSFASVKNAAGNYVAPSTSSATAAAAGVTVKPDLTFHAVWAKGANAYPITYQSWDLVFQKQSSSSTAKNLQAYIGYLLGDGQKLLSPLGYAPLPSNIDSQAKAQLSKIGS